MRRALLVALLLTALGILPASAATIVLNFNETFSNATVPGGSPPWVRATFDDTAAAAGYDVRLTIDVLGLTGNEFITETDFNLNTVLDPDQLTFNIVSATNGALEGFDTGLNAFKADGDGWYDFTLGFGSNPPRATDGNTYVIDIGYDGLATLLASDFNFLSLPSGGAGPFLGAIHLQGIATGEGSTWLNPGIDPRNPPPPPPPPPVPEPASLVLLGSGLVALGAKFRRRRG